MTHSPVEVAHTLRHGGDIDAAIKLLFQTLGDDLCNVEVVMHLAPMLAEAGREKQALAIFRRANRLADDNPFLRVNFGTFLGQLGHLDEAEGELTRVIEDLRRRDDSTHHGIIGHAECMRARVSLEAGNAKQALERARPWLTSEELWDTASDVVNAAAESLELDTLKFVSESVALGQFSPDMAAWLIELALDEDVLGVALDVAMRCAEALFPGWARAEPTLLPLLRGLRKSLGGARSRGTLDDGFDADIRILDDLLRESAN